MNTKLQQIIDELKRMQPDMQSLARFGEQRDADYVIESINSMNEDQCLETLKTLMLRIEVLEFDVSPIEDAVCQLEADIAEQDALDNPPLCSSCNGSGEGQQDGETCLICHGKGTI